MRKSKTQKGITLIALIITIIVLLILAVVAIGAVQNDGIIQYAKNARNEYELAQTNEQTRLNNYLDILNENVGSSTSTGWTQNKTTVTNGTITLNVGDTVEYVSNKNIKIYDDYYEGYVTKPYEELGSWKVLGAENGKILLMSTIDIGEVELYGATDYYNDVGIGKINAACEGYNKGIGADEGTKSRSIKLEDVDRITGFDKTTYGAGKIYGYGNEVIYTLSADGNNVTATVKGKPELERSMSIEGYDGGVFYKPDGTELQPGKTYEAEKNTCYSYDLKTYFPNTINDPLYAMLLCDANKTYADYWLASSGRNDIDDPMGDSFNIIYCSGSNQRNIEYIGVWNSDFGNMQSTKGTRPVVSLESNVQLEENSANAWKIIESN